MRFFPNSMFESKNSKLKIVILGYVVRGPLGGLAWHHAQYVLGLKKLGHDVCFIEDSDDYPACYDPRSNETGIDASYGLRFIKNFFDRLGLSENWAYYDAHQKEWFGKSKRESLDLFASADVLLNISGVNPLRDWALQVPQKVFIDTDPAFVQIRHLTNKNARNLAEMHDTFFTFGENFGAEDCLIPDDGFSWITTRQPIVSDIWKVSAGNPQANWTTVMQWDSYKSVEFDSQIFGMKSMSFDDFLDLPKVKFSENFELAAGSDTVPREKLQNAGWKLSNPLIVTRSPAGYRQFIENSKAEWSVAKHGYAASRSGWFSERSAAYLASGRPVLTQETGFSKFITNSEGLLSFSNFQEVLDGIDKINSDYKFHCKKAREIAREFFDYKNVLTNLIENIYKL